MRHGSSVPWAASRRLVTLCFPPSPPSPTIVSLRRWTSHSSNPSLIEHHHLRGSDATGLLPYATAEEAQDRHRAEFLEWKAAPSTQCPRPRLISFESQPTFTLGRRQDDLTAAQMSRLQRSLTVDLAHRRDPVRGSFVPQVKKTNRGGLTTYHGPGQLVLWPVLDMHSPLYPKFGVSSYARHLESTTQRLLADLFGIQTYTTADEPGVWVASSAPGAPRKIAALGVHHRRHVTALGIAVNVDVPVTGTEEVNPWARFVPCGLDGKLVASVASQVGVDSAIGWDMGDLAARWGGLFAEGLTDEQKRDIGPG